MNAAPLPIDSGQCPRRVVGRVIPGRQRAEEDVRAGNVVAAADPVERSISASTLQAGSLNTLVVDDDESLWGLLREALVPSDVDIVASGEEALRILRSGKPVDLLITSLDLPGRYDGLALARQACALRPGIRILYTSAYRDVLREDDRMAYHGRLLHKPLTLGGLRAAVKEAVAA
jgi:CheY-like chemotaxis protein